MLIRSPVILSKRIHCHFFLSQSKSAFWALCAFLLQRAKRDEGPWVKIRRNLANNLVELWRDTFVNKWELPAFWKYKNSAIRASTRRYTRVVTSAQQITHHSPSHITPRPSGSGASLTSAPPALKLAGWHTPECRTMVDDACLCCMTYVHYVCCVSAVNGV